jgi:hypothetical protein
VQDQLLLLLVGFILTSVLGGLLGFIFQRRAWEHQHEVEQRDEQRTAVLQLRENERAAATKVFEEISSLMDKRQYRMLQVDWKLRPSRGDPEREMLDLAMSEYRDVLSDWNSNLNRHLALVERYFGKNVRTAFESIQEEFKSIGLQLEGDYRDLVDQGTVATGSRQRPLFALNDHIYELNIVMISMIQTGEVGVTPHGPS